MATSENQKTRRRSSQRASRPSPRERLLASATHLFTTEGIRVIGIDRILREADVAKASLYSLFGSKDALVVAYVHALDEQWREQWRLQTEAMTDPVDKAIAFFDKCIEDMPAQNFRGSHFQNAASEYPLPETDRERQIIEAVHTHRAWCHETLTKLLEQHNGYPSSLQASQMLIYLDGGIAGAKLERSVVPLQMARDVARQSLMASAADYSI